MQKQWFVLHTLTGQENKAKNSIDARVRMERMEDLIGRCEIPTERVTEKKNGRKRTVTRRIFPGYVICELALYDATKPVDDRGRLAINERTWQFLRETPGVVGFVGGERPVPLKDSELSAIFDTGMRGGAGDEARPKIEFSVDETVRVNDGPFMGLTGQISMVDPDKDKLKVEVNIFNRKVQVDVESWQVEKVDIQDTLEPEK